MATVHHDHRAMEMPGASQNNKAQGKGRFKFKFCWVSLSFGLLAVFVTIPIWGIYGPVFISRFSPTLAAAFSVVVPIVVFITVLRKTCTVPVDDSTDAR